MLKERRKTKHKYFCKKCLDRNYIKQCECGKCNEILFLRDKKSRIRRFKRGHDKKGRPFLFAKKGSEHYNWKGGRKKHEDYWMLLMPDYYRSDSLGYVPEHIYFYEQYHQCCLLPWAVIHHIIPVSKDYCNNMPWNLMCMLQSEHMTIHKKGKPGKEKDKSDRFCKFCGGKTISLKCKANGKYYEHWYGNKEDGWVCHKCYKRINKYY